MLTGTYELTLDKKGRVVIPSGLRRPLGDQGVLSLAPDGQSALLAARGALGPHSYAVTLDPTTGRVLLPYVLRERLGLRPGDLVEISGERRRVRLRPAREALDLAGLARENERLREELRRLSQPDAADTERARLCRENARLRDELMAREAEAAGLRRSVERLQAANERLQREAARFRPLVEAAGHLRELAGVR